MAQNINQGPKCFACLDVAPPNYYVYGGKRWQSENILAKITALCGKDIEVTVEKANVGICRPCLTMFLKTSEFVNGMVRNIGKLSDASAIKRPAHSPDPKRPLKKTKGHVAQPVFQVLIVQQHFLTSLYNDPLQQIKNTFYYMLSI